jgi:hypothetical protein
MYNLTNYQANIAFTMPRKQIKLKKAKALKVLGLSQLSSII